MAGNKYTLRVVNNSGSFYDMCVYQVDPDIGVPNVMSLAWFSKPAADTTAVTFQWEIDYSFVWSEIGKLLPGVLFDATQAWPANPDTLGISTKDTAGNQIALSKANNAYNFESIGISGTPQRGSLYVRELENLPLGEASVGIGMSGSGTFAVQARNNATLTFTPHPVYWLAAGTYAQGEVLDIGEMTDPASIEFGVNNYSMTAILQPDNKWKVEKTNKVNFADIKSGMNRRVQISR